MNLKKDIHHIIFYRLIFIYLFLFLSLINKFVWGQTQITEGFETGMPTSAPSTPTVYTLSNAQQWTLYYTYRYSSYIHSGSYCARINTTSGSYVITPQLNTCGTITFWCRTSSGTLTNGLKIQKSVNGGAYTDVQTYTITSTITQYTCNVNDLSSNVKIKFLRNATTYVMYLDDVSITTAEPTVQSNGIDFSNVTATGMQISWTNGNGANRAVFVKQGSGTITNPTDGSTYTASPDWNNKGTQLGTSGYYCVYNGSGSTITLTNLLASNIYYVRIFEYSGSGTTSNILTSTATNNPNNYSTSAPANPTGVSAITIGFTQINISFTKNANNNNVIIAWNNTNVFGTPVNGNAYTAGNAITGGGTVLYAGGNSPYNHTSLDLCADYYYKVWSVDGNNMYSGGVTTNANTYNNMTYLACTATQPNIAKVTTNSTNQDIICIQIEASGTCNALSATSFYFNTNGDNGTGTTSPSTDISNAKLWYTGSSGTFAATSQLGSAVTSPNETFTISSFTQTLTEGTNYFWLTYDIPVNAIWDNYIDARCDSLILTDGTHIPATKSPVGARQIPSAQSFSNSNCKFKLTGTVSLYVDGDLNASNSTLFTNNGNVYIRGNIENSATYTSGNSSNIIFCGNGLQQIMNSSSLTFHDAEINNSAGVELVSGNVFVNGLLTLTSGILTTNSNIIDLNSAGSISEENPSATAPSSYVIGNVKATRNIGNSTNETFGGMGLEINETHSANSTVVTRTTGTACTNGISLSIKRYFDITPVNNNDLNAIIKIYYFDHELLGPPIMDENNLDIFKSENPYEYWMAQSYTSKELSNNWYSKTGITQFSRWTLADKDNPLPIELLSFNANCDGNNIKLKWSTITETNNDYFTIERSGNATDFEAIGTVNGAGNSNSILNYQFTEESETVNCINGTKLYYRLKQTDYDGKYSYSNIAYVNCCKNSDNLFAIGPNPNNGYLQCTVSGTVNKQVNLKVFNTFGQNVYSNNYYLLNDVKTFNIDVSNLENGIYIFHIVTDIGYSYERTLVINK